MSTQENSFPRHTLALRYAAMPGEKRELIPDEARMRILAQSFTRGEEAASVGKDLMRAAEIQWLLSHPFTDPERIGRYASLVLEELPEQAVMLCLFGRDKSFLDQHLLAHGSFADVSEYAPRIPALFKRSGASYAALFFAPQAAQYGYTSDDLRLASRLAQYCEQQKVPLLECVVAWFSRYIPLFRLYGYNERTPDSGK